MDAQPPSPDAPAQTPQPGVTQERRRGRRRPKGEEARGPGEGDAEAYLWQRPVSMLTDPFFHWDMLKVLVLIVVAMEGLILVIGFLSEGEIVILPFEAMAILLAVLFFLILFSVGVVLKNCHYRGFKLDSTGARGEGLFRVGWVYRILVFFAAVASAGLLAVFLRGAWGRADEGFEDSWSVKWKDVRKVTPHRSLGVITLTVSWWESYRLYCPRELFDEVLGRVQQYAAEGARRRAAAEKRKRSRPAAESAERRQGRELLIWALVSGLATLAAQAWETDSTAVTAVVAGLVVLVAWLFEGTGRRVTGLVAIGLTLLLVALQWELAYAATSMAGGYVVIYGYERQTPLLLISAAGSLVLLGMGALRLFGRSSDQ